MNGDNFDRNTYSYTNGYSYNPENYDIIKEEHSSEFDASNFLIDGNADESKSGRNDGENSPMAANLYDNSVNDFFANTVLLNLPGAFKYPDQMDVDESPQFTLELDVFHDTSPQDYQHQAFSGLNSQASTNNDEYNDPNDKKGKAEFTFRRSPHTETLTPNSNINGSVHHLDDSSIYSSLINEDVVLETVYPQSSLNPPLLDFRHNSSSNLHLQHGLTNELSPLTTTTSLTPSLSSIHSTQPSFFSAHQYLPRNSIDMSSSHRNSIDVYSKKRNSIDSQNSGPVQRNQISGRYSSFTDSISSYIPFIGDKRHSPISGPPSPASQNPNTPVFSPLQEVPRPHSRHLIRSIFKSQPNNDFNQNIDVERLNPQIKLEGVTPENADFLMMSPTNEELELDGLDPLPSKKIKKTKRSIFTRFKPPVKQEQTDDDIVNDNSSKNSGGNSSFLNDEENPEQVNQATSNSMSRTPSSATTVWSSNYNNINANTLDASTSDSSQTQNNEPDYAALFENVGKRKKIVKTASFKSRPKIKQELDTENLLGERQLTESFEQSISGESGTSGFSEPTTEDATPLTLANASKRILGSKLMKKKPARKPDAEIKNVKTTVLSEGVEVEVDLKTLDLPEDTRIFPTTIINSKSRTRGRKENKEADLTDLSKIYLCNYCSRRFKRQEHLKRHFRSLHTFEKPYDCPICHKKFSRSDNLNQHLKIHKEESEQAS